MNQKYAVVTGGTSGIGAAVVEMLLRRGYKIFTNYAHDDARAQAFKRDMQPYGEMLEVIKANQSVDAEINKMVDYICQKAPHIECIVCNTGATVRKSAFDMECDELQSVINTNLISHFRIIKALRYQLGIDARIIFTGSMMAVQPHAVSLAYGVSKAAVHAMAKNLVKEFAGTGITVNVVAPGFVDTDWQKAKPEAIRQNICNKTAAGRFADVQEIVGAYEFIIDNGYVNGAIIEVSGGYDYK